MRGKSSATEEDSLPGRLIPARAGKIVGVLTSPPWRRAHPRACGENEWANGRGQVRTGSSPRVRGKCEGACSNLNRAGLIPARAGKIWPTPEKSVTPRAHPRACGENDGGGPGPERAARLIPARAGKMRTDTARGRETGAHPRACGENPSPEDWRLAVEGSSPRVRGKFAVGHVLANRAGLIPARAGKIARPCRWSSRPRAHPRACGENS